MQALTLPSQPSNSPIMPATIPSVRIDGLPRHDLQVLTLELLPPPIFARATLALHAPTGQADLLSADSPLPPIGAEVRVRPCSQGDAADFCGIAVAREMALDENGPLARLVAHHRLACDLASVIDSKRQLAADGPVQLADATARLNVGRDGLCSAEAVTINGRTAHCFDASATAVAWTVPTALSYLLATAVPADIDVPPLEELETLAGGIDLGQLEVTGMSAIAALMEVARRGGLAVRAAAEGLGLVFYRPGLDGPRRGVRLQPHGARFSPSGSNLLRASVAVARKSAVQGALAIGGPKRYESTFTLSPGWDRQMETARWRDFVRSESPDWPRLCDVYRKWVLNEHGWYCPQPWSLPIHDFSSIGADDFPLPSPREFLPCLSSDPSGASLGVVVEVRAATDALWRWWRGPLWVSRDECAIYLGGDTLPGEYFQATAAGTAQLRVTCSIEADARLTAEVEGDPTLPRRTLDASSRAGWAKVDSSSIFFGRDDLGSPAERDDTAMLAELAGLESRANASDTGAELVLSWIDPSCRVGDIVERIDGRGWTLPSAPGRLPFVRAVVHDFSASQLTTLHVEG